MLLLTISQKNEIMAALGDIGRSLYSDPRRYTYDDVDEVLTLLAGRGFKVVPTHTPVAPAPATTEAPVTATTLSATEKYWIEGVAQSFRSLRRDSVKGYCHSNEVMGKVLTLTFRLAGLPALR